MFISYLLVRVKLKRREIRKPNIPQLETFYLVVLRGEKNLNKHLLNQIKTPINKIRNMHIVFNDTICIF